MKEGNKLSRVGVCMGSVDWLAVSVIGGGAYGASDGRSKVRGLGSDTNLGFEGVSELGISVKVGRLSPKSSVRVRHHSSWDTIEDV